MSNLDLAKYYVYSWYAHGLNKYNTDPSFRLDMRLFWYGIVLVLTPEELETIERLDDSLSGINFWHEPMHGEHYGSRLHYLPGTLRPLSAYQDAVQHNEADLL